MANKAKRQKAKSQQSTNKATAEPTKSPAPAPTASSLASPINITPVKPSAITAQVSLPAQLVSEYESSDARSIRSVSSVTAVASSPVISMNADSSAGSPSSGSHVADLLRAQIEKADHRHQPHDDHPHPPRKLHKPKPVDQSKKDESTTKATEDDKPNGAKPKEEQTKAKDFELRQDDVNVSPSNASQAGTMLFEESPTTDAEPTTKAPSISESLLTVASEPEETEQPQAGPSFVRRYAQGIIRLPFAIASRAPIVGSLVPVPFSSAKKSNKPSPSSPSVAGGEEEEEEEEAAEASVKVHQPASDERQVERQQHGIVFKSIEFGLGVSLAGVLIAGAGAGIVLDKVRSIVLPSRRRRKQTASHSQ